MRSEEISELIRIASILSVAFPLIFYLTRARQASKPIHFIGILTILAGLSDIVAYIIAARGYSTIILFNSYYAGLFVLLTLFYYNILHHETGRRTVVIGMFIYFISFTLVTSYVQSFFEYQTFMWTLTGMLMIIYSISYFLQVFSAETTTSDHSLLWINVAILFYFSLNLFLFVMSSYVLTRLDHEISVLIWSFHNVNNTLKNILFGFGVLAWSRKSSGVHQLSKSSINVR